MIKRSVATAVVGAIALLGLAGCPADDCSQAGAKKTDKYGHVYECKQKIGESNTHWHRIS